MTKASLAGVQERRLLFALLWPAPESTVCRFDDLADEEWAAIDLLARQHRLRPLLHDRYEQSGNRWNVPADVAAAWRRTHEKSGLRALMQRRELARIDRWFKDAAIEGYALKGAALLWRGWFDPALRPMRDIDILVEPDSALAAHALLRSHGYAGPLVTSLSGDKHLPGLTEPETGVHIELHTRLIDSNDAASERRDEHYRRAAISRARSTSTGSGVRELSATDNLLHIVLHGVLDHQFNNGPLLLFDIAALIRNTEIEWPLYWAQADDVGGLRASQVALRLARDLDPDLRMDWHDHFPHELDARVLDGAIALLQVDLDRRTELGAIGRLLRLSMRERAGRLARLARRPVSTGDGAPQGGGPPGGLVAGLLRLGTALARRDDRRHLRQSVTVANWLRAR